MNENSEIICARMPEIAHTDLSKQHLRSIALQVHGLQKVPGTSSL